jgi:hypothetical protein
MARMERSTVVGVFEHRNDAERAIDELHRAGFTDQQIGFLIRDGGEHTTHDVTTDTSQAGEGAVGGMLAGAGIGGLVAAAASLLIPGFGPVLAGGFLATTLGGAAIGAAAGGILGALVGMGVPEEEARYYESEFKAGRMLVTVRADGRFNEARDILYRCGAYDVDRRTGTVGVGGGMHADDWNTYSPRYRQHWQTHYGTVGGRWEDFEPGYRYGHDMAYDPRYQNREWSDVETDLGRDYPTWAQRVGIQYHDDDWNRYRQHARDAWDEHRREERAA